MNKLVFAIALCAALAACKKEEAPAADTAAPAAEAPAAEAPAAEAPAPAADAAAVAASLPQECQDYLARARTCFSKVGNAATVKAFDDAIKQSEAQWNQMADKSQLGPVCKSMNDTFTHQVAALKCE